MKNFGKKTAFNRILIAVLLVGMCISTMPIDAANFAHIAFAEENTAGTMELYDDSGSWVNSADTTKEAVLTPGKQYDLRITVNLPQDTAQKKVNVKLEDGLLFVSGKQENETLIEDNVLRKVIEFKIQTDKAFEISKIANAVKTEIFWSGQLQSTLIFSNINIKPLNDKGWYKIAKDFYTVTPSSTVDLSEHTAKADSRQGYKSGSHVRRIKKVTVNLTIENGKEEAISLTLKEGAAENGWSLSGEGRSYELTKTNASEPERGFDYLNERLPIIVTIKSQVEVKEVITIEGTGSITGIDGSVSAYATDAQGKGKIFEFHVVPETEDVIVSFRSLEEALRSNLNASTYTATTSIGEYFDSVYGLKKLATTSVGNRGGVDSRPQTIKIDFLESEADRIRIKAFNASDSSWLANEVTFTTKRHEKPMTVTVDSFKETLSVISLCAATGIETDSEDWFTSIQMKSPKIPKDGFYTFNFFGLSQKQEIGRLTCAEIAAYDDDEGSGKGTEKGKITVNFQNVYNAVVYVPNTKKYEAGEKLSFSYDLSASVARADMATDDLKILIVGNIKNAIGFYLKPENIALSYRGQRLKITDVTAGNEPGADEIAMTTTVLADGRPLICLDLANLENGKGKLFGANYDAKTGTVNLKNVEKLKLTYDIQTSRATPKQSLKYTNDVILYSEDTTTGRSNICVPGYGQTYLSNTEAELITKGLGVTLHNAAGKQQQELSRSNSVNTYTIENHADFVIRTGSKHETATDYHVFDGSNYVEIGKENSFQIKTDMINTSGKTINGSEIYIPIPKIGEAWGELTGKFGEFDFSVELATKATLSDNANTLLSSNPDMFKIYYGIGVNPTSQVSDLKNQEEKFIEESKFDIKNLPNVNCVKIQLVDIAPQNADSDDEEAYIAANTFSVFLNARIGESAEITNGQKDAWQPLYYLNLGHETRYAYGEAVGILTKTGKVSGYIWEDTNKNGIMDDSEAIAPSYTGWTVEAYMPGTTLSGAPIRKSTISDEGKYEIHDLSGNYDLVVRRPDFDEIAFTVLSSAQGGNRFKGVLDSDSRQTSGIAEMVEAGIETDEVKYVCNIGVLSKENMLTTIYFKISDLLDRVSPNAGTSYGEFTGDGDLASREASGSPWKKISFPEVLPKAGYAFLKWVMQDETDITEDTFGFAVKTFWALFTEVTPAKAEFAISKAFNGGTNPEGRTYTFGLYCPNAENKLIEIPNAKKTTTPENQNVRISDDSLSFKKEGIYIAAIREEGEDDDEVKYDNNYYIYRIMVSQVGRALKITKIEDAAASDGNITESTDFAVLYNPVAQNFNRGNAVVFSERSNTWVISKIITNEVHNKEQDIVMPETGGTGTMMFAGFSLLSAAAAVVCLYRRRREKAEK